MASKRKSNSSAIPVQERKRRHEDIKQNVDGNDMNVPCMCMCIDYSRFESIIRRVVKEELAEAHDQSPRLMPNDGCGGISKAKPYELRFIDELKGTYYTESKILSDNGDSIQIGVYDVESKCIVKDGALSCIKIEICAVDGDFGSENRNWNSEELNSNILRPRGKTALLKGDTSIILKDGIGFITKLEFTDNSSWVRTRKFRLAAKSKEPNIREAMTEPFMVKDKRGKGCEKQLQPESEVWRLRNIGKGGNLHTQLSKAGIETVKDFMRLYTTNPSSLEEKFGHKYPRCKWEDIIKHAKDCVIDDNEHYIYYAEQTPTSLVFNSIYEVEKVSIHGQNYRSPETLNSAEKEMVEQVKEEAYKNEKDFIPIELKVLENIPVVGVVHGSGTSSSPPDHQQLDLSSAGVAEAKFNWEYSSPLCDPLINSWEQPNAFFPFEELNYPPSQFLLNSDVPIAANATRKRVWNKIRVVLKWLFILCRPSTTPT